MEIWEQPWVVLHAKMLAASYKYWLGEDLFSGFDGVELSRAIYMAPFVVVSHGIESDPIFNYANKEAQQLWDMSWGEFTKLPSRLSAEPIEQSERKKHLEEAQRKGLVFLESGVRVRKGGERFNIKGVTLFNVLDTRGCYCGQAAVFQHWDWIAR